MNPKERMGAFLSGEAIDRVPVVPLILNHAARIAGMTVKEHNRDGAKMGAAHVAAYRFYGQDMITIFTDTAVLAEAMGTKLYYPQDDAARVDEPLIQSPQDVDRIIDADPSGDNSMRPHIEAARHCVNEVGDEVFVGCCFGGPFTTAACLRGTDMLARDVHRNPDLVRDLLDRSVRVGLRYIDACVAAGGVPVICEPVATGSVLSEDQFRSFAMPGITQLINAIHEKGLPAVLHICGRTHLLFEAMVETGADVLSLDEVDLGEARQRIGHQVTLMGNVCPSGALLEGTPEEVEAEAIDCLRKAGDSPKGFILASGCEVPLEAPRENVQALITVADRWGKLPLELPS